MNQSSTPSRPLAVGQIAIGAVLLAAAAGAWKSGTVAETMAVVHEQNATLRGASINSARVPSWMAPIVAVIDPDVRLHDATASYWRSEYSALTDHAPAGQDGSVTLMLAANAAFRRAQGESGRALSPERLDQLLQGYAGVL